MYTTESAKNGLQTGIKQMPTLQSRWNEIVIGLIKYSRGKKKLLWKRIRNKTNTTQARWKRCVVFVGCLMFTYFLSLSLSFCMQQISPELKFDFGGDFFFPALVLIQIQCVHFRTLNGCLWWVISTHIQELHATISLCAWATQPSFSCCKISSAKKKSLRALGNRFFFLSHRREKRNENVAFSKVCSCFYATIACKLFD